MELESVEGSQNVGPGARGRSHLMAPGCAVLLDINNGDRVVFAHLNPNARVTIGKSHCSLEPLVGSPFGSNFDVQPGSNGPCLVRLSPSSSDEAEGVGDDVDDAECRDNRGLVDNNTAQTLSAEDICRMRREGVSGKGIVEALVANSASFEGKTAFSQEKYRRKKQKKYAPRVVVRCPCARSVCEAYFAKDPNKIGFLRMDMLALLLSLSNVGADAEVLVLDMLGGLLTAAVAERLGGHGSVCSTFHTPKPQTIDIMRLFNFDVSTSSRVLRAPLSQLIAARDVKDESSKALEVEGGVACLDLQVSSPRSLPNTPSMEEQMRSKIPLLSRTESKCDNEKENKLSLEEGARKTTGETHMQVEERTGKPGVVTMERRPQHDSSDVIAQHPVNGISVSTANLSVASKAGLPASFEDVARWGSQGFTSLIVGAPHLDPWVVAHHLVPLLATSAPFVIYHPYLQPLAECMERLRKEQMAVSLKLSEPWLREYQVFPSRTHPHMQMSFSGGYVLSGIRIVSA